MDLYLSKSTHQVPTRYSDNMNESNSVINLMFLRPNLLELNNYMIHPEQRYSQDHTSLTVHISIGKEHIPTKRCTIIKISEEKDKFIVELINNIKKLDTKNLTSKFALNQTVQRFADKSDNIWFKYSKLINITKYSKAWWNEDCQSKLAKYRMFKQVEDWKSFRSTIRETKQSFFDNKIQEIALRNQGPWKLMNQVKKCKLPAIKTIQYNGQPCIELNDL